MMADDQLDMLIELGGSTHMNKLEVMAYRPAPLSASWLGYPHSAGLSTIDYLLTDAVADPPGGPTGSTEELVRLLAGYRVPVRILGEEATGPASRKEAPA